jgi:hypothetical protein
VSTLEFRVHGGYATPGDYQRRAVASVRPYHDGPQIVRETFGLNSNDRDVNAKWDIREFAGEWVRLVVADNATDPWGFISATGFTINHRQRSLGKDPCHLPVRTRPRWTRVGAPLTPVPIVQLPASPPPSGTSSPPSATSSSSSGDSSPQRTTSSPQPTTTTPPPTSPNAIPDLVVDSLLSPRNGTIDVKVRNAGIADAPASKLGVTFQGDSGEALSDVPPLAPSRSRST